MIKLAHSSAELLCKKLVVVDGIPGCGKTMLSRILSSLSTVEKISYSLEIQDYCHLFDFDLLSLENSGQSIRTQLNYLLYNQMMGRNTNYRYSDISSVFQNLNKIANIKRLFSKGDECIPERIAKEKPIFHLATHGVAAISQPLFEAMPSDSLFINMLRHPLFLLRQNIWNMTNLINDQRSFWIYYLHENKSYPYFYKDNESLFINSNPKEKAIYFIEWFVNKQKNNYRMLNDKRYCEITFESLVFSPNEHIENICKRLDITTTVHTKRILRKEKIPRTILSDGRNLKIYKRVGWVKSETNNLADEIAEMKKWAHEGISSHASETLERLCSEYEQKNHSLSLA